MESNIKELIIDGAKFTASNDLNRAARCYADILDLQSAEGDGDVNPDHLLLLASCLYQIGLEKNDMFGADNSDDGDNSDDQSDDEQQNDTFHQFEDESNSGEEDEQDDDEKPPLNPNLYQFDYEEEDLVRNSGETERDPQDNEGGGLDQNQEKGGYSSDDSDDSDDSEVSGIKSYRGHLEGDHFQNSLELLHIARVLFLESMESEIVEESKAKKLTQIHDLLGDLSQEFEDFEQAITNYNLALGYLKKYESQNNEIKSQITNIYLKITESLRWCNGEEELTKKDREQYLKSAAIYLQARIDEGYSKDSEEDKQQLIQIEEDLEELKTGASKKRHLSSMDTEMLKQLILQKAMGFDLASSEETTKSVNDLTSMVKKKKPRK